MRKKTKSNYSLDYQSDKPLVAEVTLVFRPLLNVVDIYQGNCAAYYANNRTDTYISFDCAGNITGYREGSVPI